MRNKELIKILESYPEDMDVKLYGGFDDVNDPYPITQDLILVKVVHGDYIELSA